MKEQKKPKKSERTSLQNAKVRKLPIILAEENDPILIMSKGELFIQAGYIKPILAVNAVFDYVVDRRLESLDCESSADVEPTTVDIYRIKNNTTLKAAFKFISKEVNDSVLTPNQIISFCEYYKDWFTEGYVVFFLTKIGKTLETISVYSRDRKLGIDIQNFNKPKGEIEDIWSPEDKVRIVVKSN